jgi:hypothetical protein
MLKCPECGGLQLERNSADFTVSWHRIDCCLNGFPLQEALIKMVGHVRAAIAAEKAGAPVLPALECAENVFVKLYE